MLHDVYPGVDKTYLCRNFTSDPPTRLFLNFINNYECFIHNYLIPKIIEKSLNNNNNNNNNNNLYDLSLRDISRIRVRYQSFPYVDIYIY